MLSLKRLPTALTRCRCITTSTTRRQLDEADEADEEPFEGFFQSLQDAHQKQNRALANRNRSIRSRLKVDEHTKSAEEPKAVDAGHQVRLRRATPARVQRFVTPSRSLAELEEYIRDAKSRMRARKPRVTMDYLSPMKSHLLNLALTPCLPPNLREQQAPWPLDAAWHGDNDNGSPSMLPHGHHLVYFPPLLPATDLLPDGTDPYHSPGKPFVRRMWAGGSMQWNPHVGSFPLDGRPAWCRETVGSPILKLNHGGVDDMVFVTVTRMYFFHKKPLLAFRRVNLASAAEFLSTANECQLKLHSSGNAGLVCPLVETRTLVFVKKEYVKKPTRPNTWRRLVEPKKLVPHSAKVPDFEFKAVPDAMLLFHFSALSHNAHAIHLDPDYARHQEGHKRLLVQGPLSVVLMLSAMRARLRCRQGSLQHFSYRNLTPLYAGDELRVCLRDPIVGANALHVSILGPDGRLAVRGTAIIN